MTAATQRMVQPGLDMATAYVFTAFPAVVHIQHPHRVGETKCGQRVRYIARPGDEREYPLCHTCGQEEG